MPTLNTIGFTGKCAEDFFMLLEKNGVRRVWDTRLHNVSQLAGFAKGRDLTFFLNRILGIPCTHCIDMAPEATLLASIRAKEIAWPEYAEAYRALIEARRIDETLTLADLDGACLLCSEHRPEECHRKILAEYLQEKFEGLEVRHLV